MVKLSRAGIWGTGGDSVARDPVCGMNVREDKYNNLRSEFKGQSYFFCLDKCQLETHRPQ